MTEELIKFIELQPIKASEANENNEFLLKRINDATQYYATQFANLLTRINNVQNSIRIIGEPQMTFSNTLPNNCIWLEGQEVSRETYSALFAIYETTYGKGNGVTTFNLPNLQGRVFWGSKDKGYIEAGLPNITGHINAGGLDGRNGDYASGAFYEEQETWYGHDGGRVTPSHGFNASRCSSIYGKSNTVQPPSIKVRVYTRYQ